MEANENEYRTVQTLWGTENWVLKGKYIAVQAYLKKHKRSKIHNLNLHLKEPEKEQEIKPNASWKMEIIKIRGEIHDIETNKKTWLDQGNQELVLWKNKQNW